MRKNGFAGIFIIILAALTIGLFYFVTQLNNSHKNFSNKENHLGKQPEAISNFDLGQPYKPPAKFMFSDAITKKIKFFNRDGKILAECGYSPGGDISSFTASMSPDLTKVIYPTGEGFGTNINLITGNCESDKQVTFLGRNKNEKYDQISTFLLGWAPDSERFLFYLNTSDTMGPPYRERYPDWEDIEGIYLHDLKTGKNEKISNDYNETGYSFFGWPNNFENPIFTSLFERKEYLYELDLTEKKFKPISTKGFSFASQYYFPNNNVVLWIDGFSEEFSQIIISTIDRSKEFAITPKGRFLEFQRPSLSPDKQNIGYTGWQGDGTYFTSYNITNSNIKKIKINTGFFHWFDNSKIIYATQVDGKIYIGDLESGKSELFADGVNMMY